MMTSARNYILNNDIDLTGTTYTHGGVAYNTLFTGSFNGNGYAAGRVTGGNGSIGGLIGYVDAGNVTQSIVVT